MESPICDLCGTEGSSPLFKRMDRFSGESFQYQSCTNCSLIYLRPRPGQDEILRYYPANYEAHQEETLCGIDAWHARQANKKLLSFMHTHINPPGRMLDVGCARGDFAQAAQDAGWEVEGIELVESAAQIARQKYALEVFTGSIEAYPDPAHRFDVITFWDVLEHLPSPTKALERCYALLKDAGKVFLSIPNLASFDRALFGNHWIGWDAPRHLTMFNAETMTQVLDKEGFRLIQRKCILGAKGAFLLSLNTRFHDSRMGNMLKRLSPVISALLWPYRQLSYQLSRAPVITYVAEKRVPRS